MTGNFFASFAVLFAHFAVKTLTLCKPPQSHNRRVRKEDRKGGKVAGQRRLMNLLDTRVAQVIMRNSP